MKNEEMRESLEQLRTELHQAKFSDPAARERLEGLVSSLEARLELDAEPEPDPEEEDSLLTHLRDGIRQLELEHPQATAILNRFFVALGGAGI